LKKIENYRTNLIHKFRDIKNEIRFILYKRKRTRLNQKFIGFNDTVFPEIKNDSVSNSLKKRLDILIQAKEIVRKQIVSYKNSYYYIDSIFNQEIKYADSYRNFFLLFSWFYFLPIGKNTNTSTFDMNKLTENEICNNNFL
jgi:antitoxin component YwqK of YwqJK toxin-antitoxin module